ncbi:hypothetical protein RhiirA1_498216 [Rhizophagus irregularis]|uniref:Uncharacterized protein n=1 Tax=Rhizophagus irregularis TaxID=588596 RepID=A0A2N0R2B2_9GLOM|nr:hypothetical protein RhiirA1_498216 [Rhizophagus irregularis]
MSEIIQDLKNSRCRSYSWSIVNICDRQRACSGSRCGSAAVRCSFDELFVCRSLLQLRALALTNCLWLIVENETRILRIEQKKTDLELHKINGVIQAVTYVQCYADALSDGVIANLELASEPITSARRNERKRPAEESFTTITPPPNLHSHTPPPLQSNDRYESDVRITREVDNSPFIAQTGEDSTKYKWVTQNGHNISTDFRNFQLKSIEKLKTNPTLSYAKEISLILANSESESSKERRLLDGHRHGRKPDFRILSKIDDIDREFIFGEIKPPHCPDTVNKSVIKLAEFMKGSLYLIINIYGYVAGLEMYGILICGRYSGEKPEMWCSHVHYPFKKLLENNLKHFSKNGFIQMIERSYKDGDLKLRDTHFIFIVLYMTSW